MKLPKAALYTFLAVFVTIFLIGAVSIPFGLDYAERTYLVRQAEFNARQASIMARFVNSRLAEGASPNEVINEFQYAIAGTDAEVGYVCLIDQADVRYLSHPDENVRGMPVKPQAVFDPDFAGSSSIKWEDYLRRGDSDTGLLHMGEGMPTEVINFVALEERGWTVSAHENTAQMEAEISSLRRLLTLISILVGMAIAVPASLAARRVNKHFENQIEEKHQLAQQLLESENARKTHELEGARHQQLSMLPAAPPSMPSLEMALYMKPAMEVGGDYYDYHIGEDDTVTIAIGDATGHGLEASTLVTAIKTLFASLAHRDDLVDILDQANRSIKRVGFSKLYMAFALARIKGDELELAGAGMPAALIYRHQSQKVEEIPLKGLPLGSSTAFPYAKTSTPFSSGDVLLLMSDGFPEQFNPAHEELGYDRAASLLASLGSNNPDEIVARLESELSDWQAASPQSDDVTFVVVRAR